MEYNQSPSINESINHLDPMTPCCRSWLPKSGGLVDETFGSRLSKYFVKPPFGGSQVISTSLDDIVFTIPPRGFSGPWGSRVVTTLAPLMMVMMMVMVMVTMMVMMMMMIW